MISKIIQKKSRNAILRGRTSERMLINWRHYHSSTSLIPPTAETYTLYDNGMTTAFPYAYGTIPVPFDCYVSSVTMTANKYSSYGTPTGTSATVYVYKNYNTLVTSKTLNYTGSEGMVLTFDFGTTAPINADEKISLRFYADGLWRYMASTTILTER